MYRISISVLIIAFSSFKLIECGIKVIADDRFLEDCLNAHNKYRDLHEGTQRLRINRTATDNALNRIRTLAKIDGHRPSDNRVVFGENFYWYYDNTGYHSCHDAVELWYKGIHRYDYNRPGFSDKTGGFSQVVWRQSQYLGCARVEDDTRRYFETYIVCNYWPAGNVDGQYPFNVYPIKDHHSTSSVDKPLSPAGGGSWSGSGTNEWTGSRPEETVSTGSAGSAGSTGSRPGQVNRPISSSQAGSNTWTNDRPVLIPDRPVRPAVGRPPKPSPPDYPLMFVY